jgi:hypothetical protein
MHKEMMDREASQAFNDAMARAQAKIQPIAATGATTTRRACTRRSPRSTTPSRRSTRRGALGLLRHVLRRARQGSAAARCRQGARDRLLLAPRRPQRKYHLDGALDDAGKDGTKNKTGIQAMGSTVSYLRRYLVCMIFNVSTDDDNDGNGGGGAGNRMDEKTLGKHLDMINGSEAEADVLKNFAKAYNEAEELKDKDAQRQFLGARDNRRKELAKGRRA